MERTIRSKWCNNMATMFSYEKHEDSIYFWTNNEELLEDIDKYICNCLDATSWRNRVEKVRTIEVDEE